MSHNHQLGNSNDLGSEQTNSSEDELIRVSPLRNSGKELEGMEIRDVQLIKPILERLIRQIHNPQLGNNYNLGSEHTNISEENSRKELEGMVIHIVQCLIKPIVGGLIQPIMEGLIRKVVKEELEVLQENILTIMKRNPQNENRTFESRSLKLKFSNELSLPIFTGEKIKGNGCTSIEVALFDGGKVVKSCPEASAKVEIVVLEGGVDGEGDNWAPEEFDKKIVGGKDSRLAGNKYLKLNEGIGYVGNIKFKHDSRWTKKCEIRLGARIVDNFNGTRIVEAKTEPFFLKDRRSIYYKKHETPSLSDDVWRLVNIRKGGPLHKRLTGENINTVKDFLFLLYINTERLREILRVGDKMWEATVAHARKCIIDKALYYCPGSQQNTGVIFNVVGQVQGLLSGTQLTPIGDISESEKDDACKAVVSAFEHREDIIPFDDEASLLQYSLGGISVSDYEEIPQNQPFGVLGHGPNSHFVNPASVVQDSVEDNYLQFLNNNCGFQDFADDYNPHFVDDNFDFQQSPTGAFVLVGAQTALHKTQIRWTMVSSVMRWLSIRRIVALGIHVQKKSRF